MFRSLSRNVSEQPAVRQSKRKPRMPTDSGVHKLNPFLERTKGIILVVWKNPRQHKQNLLDDAERRLSHSNMSTSGGIECAGEKGKPGRTSTRAQAEFHRQEPSGAG